MLALGLTILISGNDVANAREVARALAAQAWSAQVLRVRVDRIGEHRVAGIVLSGERLKPRLDPAAFLTEAQNMVARALAAAPLEEADLWVVVPARPHERTVFTVTARRGDAKLVPYWDPAWRAGLARQAANR